jgi:hypothetical protein
LRYGREHEIGITQGRQSDERRAVWEESRHFPDRLYGKACLTDASGPREREQSGLGVAEKAS